VSYSKALDKERAFSASKDKIIVDLGIRLDQERKMSTRSMLVLGVAAGAAGYLLGK
jgi:hypothetical protein